MTVTQEQIREASKKAGSIKKLGKEIGTSDASLYQYLKDSDRLSEDMRNKIERGVIRVLMPEPEVNMPIQAKAALQMAAGAERSIQLPEEKPLPNTIEIVRLVQREAQGIEDSSSLEEEFLDMALRVVRMAKRNRRLEAERAGINMLLGEKK
jgi:UDP-N-acetylglucosamine 2-epimerase